MPSEPFETAILTTALYGVMLIVLNMFSVVSQWVFIDSIRVRLGEAANQVAYEIANIYAMCMQSKGELYFFKPIEIPAALSEHGYAIELKNIKGVWYVVAYLEANKAINASSPIWKETGGTVFIGPPSEPSSFTITRTIGTYTVHCTNILHSGISIPAVWASKSESGDETVIRVGLGWVESGGG